MYIDSDDAARSILADHLAQLVLQMVVKTFNFEIYMCTGETGVVYKILLYCPNQLLQDLRPYIVTQTTRTQQYRPLCVKTT